MLSDAALLGVVLKIAMVLGVGGVLLALERRWPRRAAVGGWQRPARNVVLSAISTALARWIVPAGAVGFAAYGHDGLLPRLGLPDALGFGLALLLMDAAIYAQHRLFHRFDVLWRVHRVHHSDTGFDASLGLRFHPAEILLSLAYKCVVIAAFGVPATVVAVHEALLLGFALWTHTNLALSPGVDRMLRWVVVTPDWHRIHHSVHADECQCNFGNVLSVWDRCFGTARADARDGQTTMQIGLPDFRNPSEQAVVALLLQPLRAAAPLAPPPAPGG